MFDIALERRNDLQAFRNAARGLIAAGIPPQKIIWRDSSEEGLFTTPYLPDGEALSVPAGFVALAEDVICHTDPERLGYFLAIRQLVGE